MSESGNKADRDLLLEMLVKLTQHHQRPYSAEGLTAGLPLDNGKLTPALFVRAAERAGFSASHLKRTITEISELVLPVILILKDGHCCILWTKSSSDIVVTFADESEVLHELPIGALDDRYTGQCLFMKPDYHPDDMSSQESGDHWFWGTIRVNRHLYSEVIVASLLVNVFALVTPLFVMNVYDRVVPNQALETLWVLASGVIIVYLFDLAMKSLRGYFIDTAGKRADILLSAKTFARVMDIKMNARPGRVGSFASNLSEFDNFRDFFTSTTLIALIDLPFVVFFILLIYMIGGVLAWIPLIAIPLVLIAGWALQKPLHRVITQTFAESARKQALLIETLTALDTIKGLRGEGVMQSRWEAFNSRLAKLGLRARFLSLAAVNLSQLTQQASTIAVVILGVYQIIAGELSVGGLIACTILTGRCLAPMAQVASIVTRYHHSMAAYKSIDNVMNLPVERPEGHKFLHRSRIDGEIEFRNVSFAYPGQSLNAVDGISLKISAGERVAIIGKTGSGKSTLQRLILKFYEPDSGSILVSGTDLRQLDPNDLRRAIGYVPQEVTLFSGSVRENIVLGAPLSTDDEVLRAARQAGIDAFLDQHPEGYDLAVGERGQHLSGGQRQGIAIARALIDDADILLMDEPTNALDNTTELAFVERLKLTLEGKTLILVTHKSSMLSLVDRLIVLNNGKLVADGPRQHVLNMLSGGVA